MKLRKEIHNDYTLDVSYFDDIIENFEFNGEDYGNQDRNTLKLFDYNGETINVKSFKKPNFINQIVYKFFRKSKAQRSFEYANKLLELNIGTPQPIAYYEYSTFLFFKRSYYLSKHLQYDLTYRELTHDHSYPEHETILRAFTRFTFNLHEKGVYFMDHSPGNTLIIKAKKGYDFFLVDLNRMKFRSLSLKERIKNFERLTIHKSMVEVMSDEYAKCIKEDYNKVFDLMWTFTQNFQNKFHRKRKLKQKLFFWR